MSISFSCTFHKGINPDNPSDEILLNTTESSCIQSQLIKKVTATTGIIWFNTNENAYIISVPTATIDSEDLGITCNLPLSLKKDGLKVKFDGEYRKYDGIPAFKGSGQEYYYLKLTHIKKLK
ncbi:hypothetical protein GCM10023187_53860 [Nibrella viscosa]|uniref:Uncharacterized protein n=1 Tax=Nibrella viscosa TaxID=1084524 RepID=A0ABP8KZZ3_9BACT